MRDEPGLFKAQLIAVSLDFRRTSADPERAGLVASEALDVTLTEMASRERRPIMGRGVPRRARPAPPRLI